MATSTTMKLCSEYSPLCGWPRVSVSSYTLHHKDGIKYWITASYRILSLLLSNLMVMSELLLPLLHRKLLTFPRMVVGTTIASLDGNQDVVHPAGQDWHQVFLLLFLMTLFHVAIFVILEKYTCSLALLSLLVDLVLWDHNSPASRRQKYFLKKLD